MKLQIRTTFDFGKLAKKMPDILKGTSSTIAKQWEKETLSNIDSRRGRDGSGLKENEDRTKLLKGHDRVMIEEGHLYMSIRAKSDTLSMNEYGWWHHTGTEAGHKNRPKRPFIGFSEGHPNYESNSQKVMKSISKDIGKALKK